MISPIERGTRLSFSTGITLGNGGMRGRGILRTGIIRTLAKFNSLVIEAFETPFEVLVLASISLSVYVFVVAHQSVEVIERQSTANGLLTAL